MTPIELPSSNGAVPIRCFTGESLLPDHAARTQLEWLAGLPGVVRHVAVLPDVHVKSRNLTPTGTVAATRDVIVPRAIDRGVGCGIAMIATSLPVAELNAVALDQLFGQLMQAIPVKDRDEPILNDDDLLRLLSHGLDAPGDPLGVGASYKTRVENCGVMTLESSPDDVFGAMLRRAMRKGNRSVGTLGAGNHFLELQEIVEVLDSDAASQLGLALGGAFFMLHTDARRVGKKVIQPVSEEAERTHAQNGRHGGLWAVPLESDVGRRYVRALATACHAAFVNRAVLVQILRQCLRQVLGDATLDLPLLFDCGHETIQAEVHAGERVWVHRHGASRALPASHLANLDSARSRDVPDSAPHTNPTRERGQPIDVSSLARRVSVAPCGIQANDPVLGRVGQPVPIPGSMGTDSYVAVVRPGATQTFHSVAHGAGRVMEKATARTKFKEHEVADWMWDRGVRLYRHGTDDIAGQMPATFKDPARVVQAMQALDLIRPVVRLRPIAVLKG